MALLLAAVSAVFGWKPTISLWALAKPRITRDRTNYPGLAMPIACGASEKAVIT
jgi:hypothetical protein